jgi:hypothetical protein
MEHNFAPTHKKLPQRSLKRSASSNADTSKDYVIEVEALLLVKSDLTMARKNLKRMQHIYDKVNGLINQNEGKFQPGSPPHSDCLYSEIWFMFMDEIVHIQHVIIKSLIEGTLTDYKINEFVDKIKLITKPISIIFFGYKPPQVKLFVPQIVFDRF